LSQQDKSELTQRDKSHLSQQDKSLQSTGTSTDTSTDSLKASHDAAPKRRSPRQQKSDEGYRRKAELFTAYCAGVGIPESSTTAAAIRARSLREMKVIAGDASWTPERLERLARYALSENAWRGPAVKPSVIECLKLADGWIELGEPESGGKKPKATARPSGGTSFVKRRIAERTGQE
jgi:hypothetical protein